MEEVRQTKNRVNLTLISIFLIVVVSLAIAVYQKNIVDRKENLFSPAILEDSLSNKTNTILDTVSRSTTDGLNKVLPEKIGE
jgi:hypothetical protein